MEKYVLLDPLGRMVVGPMGSPVSFVEYEDAARAALRKMVPMRVAKMTVVMDPTAFN